MRKEKRKNRLYLAFYDVKEQAGEDDPFHVALVLLPKNPNARGTDSWIFDVKMVFTVNGPAWELRCAETRNRSFQLAALVFLAKLPSACKGECIAEILRNVPVFQDSPDWKCTDWVSAAMQRLVDEKILKFALKPAVIIGNGRKFVEAHVPVDLKKRVPTCDITGTIVRSEILPLDS